MSPNRSEGVSQIWSKYFEHEEDCVLGFRDLFRMQKYLCLLRLL